ncbi:copia-type polyprotein, partial [Trifolium medium]|nr:copia-type polyprotein [Trifolium medium]
MDLKIESIEKNITWELTKLPKGANVIGVKWIYKTKYNEKANKKWNVFQLDVKSAFLHGELAEDIYVYQPLGYQKGGDDMVYKLKKALYELRQAPRAWYIDSKILIVSLYVDDLIYTGNDNQMMEAFKDSMEKKCAMTDLGKMKYFLGIEVTQSNEGIFICQQKYAAEILSRFGMDSCNKVCSPIVPGCKLAKNENGKASDARLYKQMVGSLMYLLAT